MRIALDAQGGKAGPRPVLDAALRSARETGAEFLLCGAAEPLRRALDAMGVSAGNPSLRIVDAPDAVAMGEDPLSARERPSSSVMVAAEQVSRGNAQALLTTGNPGAAVVASLWHIKKLHGVLKAAVATTLRTQAGPGVLLDCGASPECKPWHLLQFALMGCAYAKACGVRSPRVGLLSMGPQWGPGGPTHREALPLLAHSGLDSVGALEGDAFAAGAAEVAVCDGATGAVCAGLFEGAAASLAARACELAAEGRLASLRRRLVESALARAAAQLRPGLSALLGLEATVLIARGTEDAETLTDGIRGALRLEESRLAQGIREGIEERDPRNAAGVFGGSVR